jgi:hypothetical protein
MLRVISNSTSSTHLSWERFEPQSNFFQTRGTMLLQFGCHILLFLLRWSQTEILIGKDFCRSVFTIFSLALLQKQTAMVLYLERTFVS